MNLNDIKAVIKDLGALAIGMGWGISDKNTKMLKYIIKNYKGILIIDADGLNILANLFKLRIIKFCISTVLLH